MCDERMVNNNMESSHLRKVAARAVILFKIVDLVEAHSAIGNKTKPDTTASYCSKNFHFVDFMKRYHSKIIGR